MYCPHCGHKLDDDARFCSECGQALPEAAEGAATKASPEKPMASAAPRTGNLGSQVSEIRGRGRRRMPFMLFVVLVALGVATAAFAATMAWKYIISPALEQRQAEPVEAAQTAEAAATAGAGTETATTEPATTETASTDPAATTISVAAQQAVFNDALAKYKAAQDSGWDESTTDDEVIRGLEGLNHPYTGVDLSSVSYAYYDIGNDGTLDLVIANPNDYASTGNLLTTYLSDGTTAGENVTLPGIKYEAWQVLDDGTLIEWSGANDGDQSDRWATLYSVSNGELAATSKYTMHASNRGSSKPTYEYSKDGQSMTKDEYTAVRKSWKPAQLDWKPLSEFTPVQQ